MAQIVIDNIDETTSHRFAAIARSKGQSPEELAREIISRYADQTREDIIRRMDEIRQSTIGKSIVDPVEIIRKDRDTNHGRG